MNPVEDKIPLAYLIYQAERALSQTLNHAFLQKELPIVIEQWPVLMETFFHNGLTQQELADRTRKNKTTLTRIINTLEKNGLVVRRADSMDKRKKLIFYTNYAVEIKPIIIETIKRQHNKLYQGISNEMDIVGRQMLVQIFKNLDWNFYFSDKKYTF